MSQWYRFFLSAVSIPLNWMYALYEKQPVGMQEMQDTVKKQKKNKNPCCWWTDMIMVMKDPPRDTVRLLWQFVSTCWTKSEQQQEAVFINPIEFISLVNSV